MGEEAGPYVCVGSCAHAGLTSCQSLTRASYAGTALDDAIREGHNKVAEGLAGYYRVMEHGVQSAQSIKLDEPLREKAEAVMLAHEKDRSSTVRVDTTPSESEPIDEPSASSNKEKTPAKPPPNQGGGTADRATVRSEKPKARG